jgi:uncharacterized membrane protein YfcA
MTSHFLELFVITLVAATVNGALGYGFSSITVPLALPTLLSGALIDWYRNARSGQDPPQ